MEKKKIYIINGSNRKNVNTDSMCKSFMEGAKDAECETEIIHLYNVDFKGCYSCFTCKLKNGKNYGKCSYKDGLEPILNKISKGDGIVFATPIYFADISGTMKMFVERLLFPYVRYDKNYTSIAPKKLKTAVIYTMNVDKKTFEETYVGKNGLGPIGFFEKWISHIFDTPKRICAFNTYQFSDYNKYFSEVWDKDDKLKYKNEIFPKELEKAYEAGKNMFI